MKKLILFMMAVTAFFGIGSVGAQVIEPVSWQVKTAGLEIQLAARIDYPWHMYDIGPYAEGPNPTTFTFDLPAGLELDGGITQLDEPTRQHDAVFGIEIGYFAESARFVQKLKVIDPTLRGKRVTVGGNVEWQVCDDKSCLPPADEDFEVRVQVPAEAAIAASAAAGREALGASSPAAAAAAYAAAPDQKVAASATPGASLEQLHRNEAQNFWAIMIEAVLWGFAALLTPCVFPMVPMTVSFFMKGSGNRARGRMMATLYGFSIVALYTLPIAAIILVTYLIGGDSVTADIFNWLATHWVPNVAFFLIFMVFAVSFFGAFEITMPSRLVNRSDKQADKGGLVGVFFMALTLVLVSFSCTGPIVGTVLVKSTQGAIWEPIFTMIAFSVAFALPFTLFAFFPALLKNLPKSGGWLNSVKVVLGFIELALGLKFLSVADQTYHWGLLDREVYLALWIVIFTLLGTYLLGKIRFRHDSPMEHLSVKRLFLAIATFSFVVYLVPGMWGAPLKALSGYLPPLSTMDFNASAPAATAGPAGTSASYLDRTKIAGGIPKYADFLHIPHGLEGFFDYRQGIEYARAVGKPVMIDFTGHGCVNCREMEAKVWSDPGVRQLLREQYVIIALYVDDKKQLPQEQWVTDSRGRTMKTLGKINATFQIDRFGVNAQPYYVLLDPKTEQMLVPPRSYDLDINGFVTFLESGVNAYTPTKP